MKKVTVNILCVLFLTFSGLISAAEPFEAEITARQSLMQLLKFNISILGEMAKGNRDYNAELAENSAKNIHSASLMKNGAMWPEGSDNTKLPGKTDALPAIWSNYPEVVKKHTAWTEASAALSENAGKGLKELSEYIGPLGKSCQSCHKSFRAKQ